MISFQIIDFYRVTIFLRFNFFRFGYLLDFNFIRLTSFLDLNFIKFDVFLICLLNIFLDLFTLIISTLLLDYNFNLNFVLIIGAFLLRRRMVLDFMFLLNLFDNELGLFLHLKKRHSLAIPLTIEVKEKVSMLLNQRVPVGRIKLLDHVFAFGRKQLTCIDSCALNYLHQGSLWRDHDLHIAVVVVQVID